MTDARIDLEPRHVELYQRARRFGESAERLAEPVERSGASVDRVAALARELVVGMGREGLLEVAVPPAHEPRAGEASRSDLRSLCVTREGMAHGCALADALLAVQGLATHVVALGAEASLRERVLEAAAAGTRIGAFALTEPGAGSDVSAIETVALHDGAGYVLEGQKTFISNAGMADFYVIFAKTDPLAGARGLSAFLVDYDTPGLRTAPIELNAPHPIGQVTLGGVRVSANRRIGAEGEGFHLAMATLDRFRASVGAAACGLAGRALDEALARAQERHQFGQALSSLQLTQAKLAEMATQLDAARLLVYRAATSADTGAERTTRESSMAKLFATEAAQRVVDDAVQIFGGLGVVRGVPVERLYREVRALRIYEGTSEIQKLIIARELLRSGSDRGGASGLYRRAEATDEKGERA